MTSTTEPMGIEAPGQPQRRRGGTDCDNSKSTKCVVGFLFVGIVCIIVLIIRINVMGCGCPAPFSSESADGTKESGDCECKGDAFSCKYTCPGGQLYCGQELCPDQQPVNTSASGGGGGTDISTHPAGTVMCPDITGVHIYKNLHHHSGEYCDCDQTSGGDCVEQSTTRCNCTEAKAMNCCNSG